MGHDKNRPESQLARKLGSRKEPGMVADYGSVDSKNLQRCIAAIAKVGGALRFGYTRDGGAYAVGVYYSGETETVYIKPSEDFDAVLSTVIENLTA